MSDDGTIRGSAVITAGDQLRAFWWGAGRAFRIATFVSLVAMVLLLALMAVTAEDDTESSSWTLPLILLAGFVLWPVFIVWGHRRLAPEQRQVSYAIDAREIAVRDATGAHGTVPWTLARRVLETKSGFAFTFRPAGVRWVPKRALSPGGIAALRRLARAKLGKAARVQD